MTTYTDLLMEADNSRLITKEKPLRANYGRIKGNRIAIKKDMIETEKKCVLAEEIGHYHTTVGDILNQNYTENRKQERRARIWAYNRLIALSDLVKAYQNGCQSQFEIAEYLEVTEEFLIDCISYFHEKYGAYVQHQNYLIYFEPLGVLELYK